VFDPNEMTRKEFPVCQEASKAFKTLESAAQQDFE
jgi:hypothetical protein